MLSLLERNMKLQSCEAVLEIDAAYAAMDSFMGVGVCR
jgi:hypothetical protein